MSVANVSAPMDAGTGSDAGAKEAASLLCSGMLTSGHAPWAFS